MKLGEVLLAEGAIEPRQLKAALDAQLIYGGHLGTCLIELGYLKEELLGEALAWTFGVAYAPNPVFLDIPRYVIGAVPQKIVEKHSAIPFRLKDKVLDVAMIDPRNLQAVDEIRFAAGYSVQTWIAPEVRIFQAMERYYDVPRRLRYVTLCRQLEKESGPSDPATALFEHPERETQGSSGGDAGRTEAGREDIWLRTAAPRAAAPDRLPAAALRSGGAPSPVRSVSGPSVATSPASRAGGASRDRSPAPSSAHNSDGLQDDPLSSTSDLLCRAKGQDQVAELVMGFLQGWLSRRILFKIQGTSAYVWRTAGAGIETDQVASIRFPILSEPLFGLLHGDDYFLGSLPADPVLLGFYAKLGIETPTAILLLPIHLNDQLIAMLYGDAGREGAAGGTVEIYRRLAEKTALALGLVQTKQRIRAI